MQRIRSPQELSCPRLGFLQLESSKNKTLRAGRDGERARREEDMGERGRGDRRTETGRERERESEINRASL